MQSKVRQWLAPPVFESEEENRVARILYVIFITFMIAAVIIAITSLVTGNFDAAYTISAGLVVIIGSFWLARRGYLTMAGFLVLLALLVSNTYLVYKGNGIHDVAAMVFPIAIVGAGLILPPKPFITYVSLTMIALGFIGVLEMNGLINSPMTDYTQITDIIIMQTVLLITAIASRLAANEVTNSLALAESRGRALQAKNEELEREINERRETERALRESQERFRILSENAPSTIYLCHNDPRFKMIYLNDAIQTLTGYPKEKFLSDELSITDLFHEEDSTTPELDEILRDQGPFRITYRIKRADGQWRWVEDIGAGVFDEDGNLLYLAGFMTDITDRKLAVEALADSEIRYRGLFEDSPISLWEEDFSEIKTYLEELVQRHGPDFDLGAYFQANPKALIECAHQVKILDVNQATLSQFGAESKQHLLDNLFSIFTPQSAEFFRDELVQLMQGGVAYDGEVELKTLDGRPIHAVHRLVIAPGYENSWGKIFNSILDITLRKEMEAELREYRDHLQDLVERRTEELAAAKDAAEAANRAKSTFLANISHELRTPLNAIMGFTQLMQRNMDIPTHLQENLRIVNRSGEHLLNLINDILEMSKIEAGQTSFSRTTFDLPAMLTHLDETFRIRAEAKGLRLILEMPENLPRFVTSDERKLRQVLVNLLSNAVKFTQTGYVALRVALDKLEGATAVLQFIVEDTGPGIADEQLADIFEPFAQTTTDLNPQQGTGLGLPISRQFIRLLGSELEVTSQVGQGSIFRFTLQVSLAVQKARPAAAGVGRVIGLAPNQPEYRILVVEDRYENRILMRRLLEMVGFTVREAANGAEAVEVHRLWQPHLIWMDMRMPVMNGYEAVSQIRNTTQGQATTIIALTASAFEEDRAVVLSAGCDDFIYKPFREVDIFEKMKKYLGVQYLYAETPVDEPEKMQSSSKLTSAAISKFPVDWREQMHQAAREARGGKLLSLLQEIEPDHTRLASQLVQLVENFRFDEIMKLTENNGANYEHDGQSIN